MKKKIILSLNLYSIFDKGLLALKECDVAFSSLVQLVLYYKVRGSKLNIYVTECFMYEYGKEHPKFFVKSGIDITDPETIRFLGFIKRRHRMQFVREAIREALVYPLYGAYYNDSRIIKLETKRIQEMSLDGYDNLVICRHVPGKVGRIRNPEVIRPVPGISLWVPEEWYSSPVSVGGSMHEELSGGTASDAQPAGPAGRPDDTAGSRHRRRDNKKSGRFLTADTAVRATKGTSRFGSFDELPSGLTKQKREFVTPAAIDDATADQDAGAAYNEDFPWGEDEF